METRSNIVIVSAFGRGNWLATELRALGLEVALVDVTDSLGRWVPEDWEGPFGHFQSDDLLQTQRARLDEEDYSEEVAEGFTLWLKSGPLDVRGTHSGYLLEKYQVSAECQKYLADYNRLSEKAQKEFVNKSLDRSFDDIWFVHLAHALGSAVFMPNRQAMAFGRPLPVFAPHFVRRVTRRGLEKSLDWTRSRNVKVFSKAKATDISIEANELKHIEVEGEWSGVLSGEQFIWALTSQESQRLSPKFLEALFPDGELKGQWAWMRYRLELQAEDLRDTLPLKFVVVEDLALPWAHSNLMWVQRTAAPDSYDVWMRVPQSHRYQKSYLEELGVEAVEIFTRRIPRGVIKISEYPQDYYYDEAVLGPSRFQVYSRAEWLKFKRRRLKNLVFDGPELWPMLDWNGQFQYQKKIYGLMQTWKVQKDRRKDRRSNSEDGSNHSGEDVQL